MAIRRRAVVRGHVQGVFFRESTRREAERHRVAGSVRNRPDGAVEVVLEGEPAAVAAVVRYLHEGPSGARVDAVDVTTEEPEGLESFRVG